MTVLPLAAALCLLAGCTETIQLAPDPLAGLVALEIVPGDASIEISELAPPYHTLQYEAVGHFRDGSLRDVSSAVDWSVDNMRLGAFEPTGLFVASHASAGRATVVATAGELSASATLTVVVAVTLVDPIFPLPAQGLFDPANPVISGDPLHAPTLIYPSDGTWFPIDIARTLFQYTRGDGNDAFRLSFDSDVLHVVVETGADRWVADGSVQRLLASSGLAGPVRVEVRATSSTGTGTVYASAASTLAFSADVPGGPLYYWSAATSGIMRGGLDSIAASKLYPEDGTCVGCHALARDNSALAMGYTNGISFELQVIDPGTLATTIGANASRPMGWATYSPDGTRLVVANNGQLTQYDARTGAQLGPVPLPAMRYATHPDWSPDGAYLAVALTSQSPNNLDVKAASIARIPYNAGAWGPAVTLVAGSQTNNNYFPRWSPDGSHIAYVNAPTSSQGATSAVLRLIDAAGGSARTLATANQRVGATNQIDLANTMPAWGPVIGERAWLAFVSSRPYAALLAGGRRQIWVTSIDLGSPGDASTPAFWVPCQDLTVLNYNPVWSSEVVTP